MLKILSEKNVFLTSKIECLSKRSIRSKLLSYLSDFALKKNTNEFKIPFNRQELADFLGVDRSALSSELSKLQKEKILKFNKNEFKLLNNNYYFHLTQFYEMLDLNKEFLGQEYEHNLETRWS